MTQCGQSQRFVWRSLGLALVCAVLALLVGYLRRQGVIPPSLRWVAALLPVVPMVWYFLGVGEWLRSLDELQRLIQLEALVVQFGLTGIIILASGLLAKFGVLPDLPLSKVWSWFWLTIFCSWAFGQVMVRRKYR